MGGRVCHACLLTAADIRRAGVHEEEKPQEEDGENLNLLWGNPKLTLSRHPTKII